MRLSIRAGLLAVLAAGLVHGDAQAQMLDAASPAEIGKVPPRRDGAIELDFGGSSRREILSRLFADQQVEIEWHDRAYANEKLWGRLKGSPVDVARRLLGGASYVMLYDSSREEPRLVRILIAGSDPPSVKQRAGVSSAVRQEDPVAEMMRRRAALEALRRMAADAEKQL